MTRITLILLLMLVTSLLYAALSPVVQESANAKRIAELQGRQQQIVLEINDRQALIQQQQQAIAGLQNELVKSQGAIDELRRQDAEAEKKATADKKAPSEKKK